MQGPLRFLDILQVLYRHGVDFLLVGGVAAILEGAPVSTFDLDVVILPSPENHLHLLAALEALHARYLDPAGRHIVPDLEKLETLRLHQLLTDHGPLDVLRSIGRGSTYADLLDETREIELAGLRIRVLRLEAIIRSKEEANREKDRAALPVLRRALELKRASEG